MSKTIIPINVNKLLEHPNNPRTELGDLTELSDSIKENGIFQNLTVVPKEDMPGLYTVIIGHRRLQAAKEAGLEEVPCAIVQMDAKKQASTMLLENMQRSDLSMYEQAQGIQMCMDLGMTEQDISKKTGFSQSTVRRRVKMLELDQDKVEKAVNATLEDYVKLEEITDLDKRNELLQFIGTNNFDYEVEKAKQYQNSMQELVENGDLIINDNHTYEEVSDDEETVEPRNLESLKISKQLRINFMKDLFKQKITGKELAPAVGVLVGYLIVNKAEVDVQTFQTVSNPKALSTDSLLQHASKHRTNYFVVAAYSVLEREGNLNEIYDFLTELGYELSDDEKELLGNVEN